MSACNAEGKKGSNFKEDDRALSIWEVIRYIYDSTPPSARGVRLAILLGSSHHCPPQLPKQRPDRCGMCFSQELDCIYMLSEKLSKFPRYNMKCSGKQNATWNIPRSIPATCHVISRKIDFIWDSVGTTAAGIVLVITLSICLLGHIGTAHRYCA